MKRQTKKLNSKKIIQVVTMLILCLILVFACIFGYSVYKDTATFDSKKLLSSGASVMYDSNGDIMYTYGSQENGTRKNVTYDDLPQVLVDAIVAAEDISECDEWMDYHCVLFCIIEKDGEAVYSKLRLRMTEAA